MPHRVLILPENVFGRIHQLLAETSGAAVFVDICCEIDYDRTAEAIESECRPGNVSGLRTM